MIDHDYSGPGASPWEGIITASKSIALQLIKNCSKVDVLKRAVGEALGDWRRSAIRKRIKQIERE